MTYTVIRNDGSSFQVDESIFDADRVIVPPDWNAIDQEALNSALAAEGSVVRALALVLLQEINTIRGKLVPPLQPYTQAQLVAALKSKMR